jgi:hypothetical protein
MVRRRAKEERSEEPHPSLKEFLPATQTFHIKCPLPVVCFGGRVYSNKPVDMAR